MKPLLITLAFVLTSSTSTLISHRMKAAQRKLLETHRLQQAGQWDEAQAMSVRLDGSVSKSIKSRPMQRSAAETTVDLRPLLAAWENGPYADLQAALKKHDNPPATASLAGLVG